MHTEAEHKQLVNALFDDNLLYAVMDILKERSDNCEGIDQAYQDQKRYFFDEMTSSGRTDWDRMAQLFRENMMYALYFGFCEGFVAGLRLDTEGLETKLFHAFTETQLLTEPYMQSHKEYYQRHCDIIRLYARLKADLDDAAQEYMQTVYLALDHGMHSVLYHAFFLGYQLARDYMKLA